MQSLRANRREIHYALYTGKEDIVSGVLPNVVKTGEKRKTYSAPVKAMANISPNQGTASIEPYGVSTEYTMTMVVDKSFPELDEETILWIDKDIYVSASLLTLSISLTVQNNEFVYIGSSWTRNGVNVTLSDYGITVLRSPGSIPQGYKLVAKNRIVTQYQPGAHNYIVTRVSRGLSCDSYTLRKVDRS